MATPASCATPSELTPFRGDGMWYHDTTSSDLLILLAFLAAWAPAFILTNLDPSRRQPTSTAALAAVVLFFSKPEPTGSNGIQRDEDYFAEARRGREEVGRDRREGP